ncbi:MAG: leucine-rich repeat domain-containing protein [Oscillospiraceae bacterium]|nr:leucine-rich repeat domain-containing protein [Oscillospiraceae bacterium]
MSSAEGESKHHFIVEMGNLKGYEGPGGEVVFPDKVIMIKNGSFFLTTAFTSVTLPENFNAGKRSTSIYDFPLAGLASLNMQISLQKAGKTFDEIKVHKDNLGFKVVDGVLYTRDMTTLILYPQGKKDKTFRVPEGVVYIANGAFLNCWNLEKITLPASLEWVGQDAFLNCKKLETVECLGYEPGEWNFRGSPFYLRETEPLKENEIPPPYPYEDRVFTNADLPTLTIDDLWWHLNAWGRRGMWRELTVCSRIESSYFVKRDGDKIVDEVILDGDNSYSRKVEMPDGSIEYIDRVGNVISFPSQGYEYVGRQYYRVLNANSVTELNEEMDRYFTGDAHHPIVPEENEFVELGGKLYFRSGDAGWVGDPEVTSLEMIGDNCLRANAPYLGEKEGPHPNTHYYYFIIVDGKLKMSRVEQVYD